MKMFIFHFIAPQHQEITHIWRFQFSLFEMRKRKSLVRFKMQISKKESIQPLTLRISSKYGTPSMVPPLFTAVKC